MDIEGIEGQMKSVTSGDQALVDGISIWTEAARTMEEKETI